MQLSENTAYQQEEVEKLKIPSYWNIHAFIDDFSLFFKLFLIYLLDLSIYIKYVVF